MGMDGPIAAIDRPANGCVTGARKCLPIHACRMVKVEPCADVDPNKVHM